MTERHDVTGACLCGAVRFTATLPDRALGVCWCSQCRRQCSGPLVAVSAAERWLIDGFPGSWRASDHATRGFCGKCGSTLYWQRDGEGPQFTLGALDARDGYRIASVVHPEDRPRFVDLEALR